MGQDSSNAFRAKALSLLCVNVPAMFLNDERAKEIKAALVAHHHSDYPPRPVIEAVAHLVGSSKISSALGTRDASGRWRCVVVTSSHIAYVEAANERDEWYSLESHRQEHTDLSAKMWRRDQIERVELTDLREVTEAWNSHAVFQVVFSDGNAINLPPDGKYLHPTSEAEFEKLLNDVLGSQS